MDHLAQVYRYRLSNSTQALTTLNAEIAFVNSYTYLLKTRYQSGISIHSKVNPGHGSANLPLLSLQLILDYAIRHNTISAQKPLSIRIETTPEGSLRVQYNRQPRLLRLTAGSDEMATLPARYATLSVLAVKLADDGTRFSNTLLAGGGVAHFFVQCGGQHRFGRGFQEYWGDLRLPAHRKAHQEAGGGIWGQGMNCERRAIF